MIVLDSSAIIEIVRNTEEGRGLQLLMEENEQAISCDLVQAEVGSVLRKLVRLGKIPQESAELYYRNAMSLIDELVPIGDLQPEVLCESIRLNHSTYDMFYFVLARRTGAVLFTLDQKLVDKCERNGVSCATMLDFDFDFDPEEEDLPH